MELPVEMLEEEHYSHGHPSHMGLQTEMLMEERNSCGASSEGPRLRMTIHMGFL